MRRQHARGFSLIELLIVVSIICVISAAAMVGLQTIKNATLVNDAFSMVQREIQTAHQIAMDQRCVVHLSFDPNGTLPNTPGQGTMTIQIKKGGVWTNYEAVPQLLPNGVRFTTFTGMPTIGTGVYAPPDGFGVGFSAIDFDTDNGGGKTDIYFQPDGVAFDAAGQINNGVVYFGRPSQVSSGRAVSLMGATGRVKGWRLVPTTGGVLIWK